MYLRKSLIITSSILAVMLLGCQGNVKDTQQTINNNEISPTVAVEPTDYPTLQPTENPTNTPTVEPTLKPTTKPTAKPTAKPTLKPTTKPTTKPTLEPTTKPTQAPSQSKEIKLDEVWSKISSNVELPFMGDIPSDIIKDYYGINSDDLKQSVAKMCMINVKAVEILMVEVKDPAKVDDVVAGIKTRVEALKKQWEFYLQDQYQAVKDYKLKVDGNYVFFAISTDADDIEKIWNEK